MKRVTIIDVAKAAGVSRQTVSRAMNDKGEISAATKQRVMEAVERLGYRPNRIAQSMVTRRTFTVGLVFPDILNPFFPEVARGVQDAAREQSYNVFLCNTDDEPPIEKDILRSLAAQPVDGIVLLGSCLSDDDLRAFADGYRPIVTTNRFVQHPNISQLIVDNVQGGRLAAEHLIGRGHRELGVVANANIPTSSLRRVQGFSQAVAARELPAERVATGAPTIEGGYQAAREILLRQPELTALFCYNDLMALGTLRACRDLGKRVPDDVAVVGFDDVHLTEVSSPTLTSVRVDKYALGRLAVERLLAMVDATTESAEAMQIPVELVQRKSS